LRTILLIALLLVPGILLAQNPSDESAIGEDDEPVAAFGIATISGDCGNGTSLRGKSKRSFRSARLWNCL